MSENESFQYVQPRLIPSEAEKLAEVAAQVSGIGHSSPLDALGMVRLVEIQAANARKELITEARRQGASWVKLGKILGISPQAVQQRYA